MKDEYFVDLKIEATMWFKHVLSSCQLTKIKHSIFLVFYVEQFVNNRCSKMIGSNNNTVKVRVIIFLVLQIILGISKVVITNTK